MFPIYAQPLKNVARLIGHRSADKRGSTCGLKDESHVWNASLPLGRNTAFT